jgi:lysophospholipase L1-like esterase
VVEAKGAGIRVVLVTPPPHRVPGPHGGSDGALVPYAEATRAVARAQGVPCIDLFTSASAAFDARSDQERTALFCSVEDRSHFSVRGAELLARMVADALARLPDSAGLLRPTGQWPASTTGGGP